MKKVLKIGFWTGVALLALVVLFAAFMQTQLFKSWALDRAINLANANLEGELKAGRLSGNLFTELQLSQVSLEQDGKPVLAFDRFETAYNPLALLSGRIVLQKVILTRPLVFLERDEQARWNITRIVKEEDAPPIETETQTFDIPIRLPQIKIESGIINVDSASAQALALPRSVQNLEIELGFWLNKRRTRATLKNLSFETGQPALRVRTIRSDVQIEEQDLYARDINIETQRSKLTSRLEVENLDKPHIEAYVSGKPVSTEEVRRFMPELLLYGNPQFDIEVQGPLHNLAVKTAITWGEGILHLTGEVAVDQSPYRYDLTGGVSHVNLAHILNDTTYTSDLNLQFDLQGSGLALEELAGSVNAEIDTSVVSGVTVQRAVVNSSYQADTVRFAVDGEIDGTLVDLSGMLTGVQQPRPRYQFDGRVASLAWQRFQPGLGLSSDVAMQLRVQGAGFDPEDLQADLDVIFERSELEDVVIDSGRVHLTADGLRFELHEVFLNSSGGRVTAGGRLALEDENDLSVRAEFDDFSTLRSVVGQDSLFGAGRLAVELMGPFDSLLVATDAHLQDFRMPDYAVAGFDLTGHGLLFQGHNRFDFNGQMSGVMAGGSPIDTMEFNVVYFDSIATFDIELEQEPELQALLAGEFEISDTEYVIDFSDLDVSYLDQNWRKTDANTLVRIRDDQIELSGLVLTSGEQSVSLRGLLSPGGDNNFTVAIRDIDLANYDQYVDEDFNLMGSLNIETTLAGTFQKPQINGTLSLKHGQYYDVSFEEFQGKFGLGSEKLTWDFALAKTGSDSLLETSAQIPTTFALSPFEYTTELTKLFEFKVSTRGLDLSFAQAFTPGIENIRGKLAADIVLRNTLRDIRGVGPIRVINGEFSIPELGLKFTQANLVLLLKEKEVIIHDFSMRSGDGYLRALAGSLSLSEDKLEDFKSKIKLKNFQLVNNEQMQARASGTVEFSGSIQAPVFSGALTVDQSRIFYETIEDETAVTLTAQPFFVISPDTTPFDTAGAIRFQKEKDVQEKPFLESDFYKRLNGELSVYFPRNAWLRGQDSAIEIEGDVVMVKDRGRDFVLFGSFSTLRGFYQLLGNRFQIQKGEIVFNGNPELNPEVSIEATTTVASKTRDGTTEKHEFMVLIGGTLLYPEFSFTLDGEPAKQGDVVSILLFGQTSEQLTGQVAGTSAAATNGDSDTGLDQRARGLLTGQLLKQLSGQLGQRLSLDVIQIESGASLKDSKVRVGKYVTPEVFISVSQDFGAEGNQVVELEYDIPLNIKFLNLLLQASSDRQGDTGMDVIWKIEW